jgi:RimJ/RimL family protein N-acetyltransferase
MQIVTTTQRLVIRKMTMDDATPFHRYRNDLEVAQYQGWETPYSLEQAEALVRDMELNDPFVLGEWTQLGVALLDASHSLIGDVAVRLEAEEPTAEIGVTFDRMYWGAGYAGEAVTAVVEHCLDRLGLARVVAFTHQHNEAAQRVLERAGLRFVATDGDELVYYRRADQ